MRTQTGQVISRGDTGIKALWQSNQLAYRPEAGAGWLALALMLPKIPYGHLQVVHQSNKNVVCVDLIDKIGILGNGGMLLENNAQCTD